MFSFKYLFYIFIKYKMLDDFLNSLSVEFVSVVSGKGQCGKRESFLRGSGTEGPDEEHINIIF